MIHNSKCQMCIVVACALLTGCFQSDEEWAREVAERKKKERIAIKEMDEHRLIAEVRMCDVKGEELIFMEQWRCLALFDEASRRGVLEPLQKAGD